MYGGECDVKKQKELDNHLMNKYKAIKRSVIGKTALNREIVSYTFGKDNGTLMCGTFHSMERITCTMLYKFLDDVCSVCNKNEKLLKYISKKGLTVVPMVNPDGVQICVNGIKSAAKYSNLVYTCLKRENKPHTRWQSNARGVDINHNFDAGYNELKKREKESGIVAPSSTRYGGECAESEEETKALCKLCRDKKFEKAVALHTQGQEIYYDFSEYTPEKSICVATALSKISGYKVSRPQGLAVGGGFKDWFIKEFHRMAFTLEIGKGENPLSPDVIITEYEKVRKMLWYLMTY